jgi:hypothetical protein
LYGAKKMNMISTGAFLSEMDASNKQPTVASKFAAVWEKKNAKAARAGGVSLMALSLAACGSSSSTTSTTSSTTTTTTTTTAADTITLTAGPDTATGGAGDTTINALTEGHLEAGDSITGGAGDDTLVIRDYDSSAGTFTMSGVETIDINFATTAMTLDLEDVTGVTNVKVDSAVADNTVANVEATMSLTLANIASGVTNIDISFSDDEFAGTADTYSVTLDDVDDGLTLSLDAVGTDAEAIETLTINTGSNDNDGAIVFDVEGQSATTVTITGSAAANLSGLDGTTINAADATGNITLTNLSGTNMTVTGGAGNDVIDMGTGLTVDDTIDGGDGTDTLVLSTVTGTILSTGTSGNVTNVSSIETLRLDTELTGAVAIDVSKLSSLTTIDFDDYNDTGTDVHVISKMNDGMTIILGDADGDADAATNTDAELDIGFAANSSSNNVTVKMENVQILKISNDDGFLDTMTINSVTGTNIIEDASELTAKKLIITGDQTLDMNTSNALATSTTIVDASAFTGILEVTASSTGTEITGGSKADIITGGAGADVISGGAGNDIIDGAGGNDTITLGAGDDEIVIDATGDGKDTIKDFVVADDFFDINSLVTDGGGYAASAETKVQTIAADADVTLGAGIVIVDNGDNDIANADSLSTTDIADRLNDLGDDNNSGAADNILSLSNKDDDFIIAISDGTDTAIVHMTGDGTNTDIAAGDLVVLAVIEGMSDAGTLTAANFDGFTAL